MVPTPPSEDEVNRLRIALDNIFKPEKETQMDTNEQKIEAEIQARNLNAPRLKPADIDAVIVGETFTVLPSGKVMICELTLKNGFTVRGEAATVSKENFNEEIGRKLSRERARDKVWELEGYLLQQYLYVHSTFEAGEDELIPREV